MRLIFSLSFIVMSTLFGMQACNTQQRPQNKYTNLINTLDSLNKNELLEDAKNLASKTLPTIPANNNTIKAHLYEVIGYYYDKENLWDTAVTMYLKANNYALKSKEPTIQLNVICKFFKIINYSASHYDLQDSLFLQLETLAHNPHIKITENEKANVMYAEAIYYYLKGAKTLALFSLNNMMDVYKNLQKKGLLNKDDSLTIGTAYMFMAETYSPENNDDGRKAYEYIQKGKDWIGNNKIAKAYYYFVSIVWTSQYSNKIAIAEKYLDSVIRLSEMPGGNVDVWLKQSYIQVAQHYAYTLGNSKIAWEYCNRATSPNIKSKNPFSDIQIYWLIANLYRQERNYAEAIKSIKKVEQYYSFLSLDEKMELARANAECHQALHNSDLALRYFGLFSQLADSVYEKNEKDNAIEVNVRYNHQQSLMEIEKHKILNKQNKKFEIALIAGLILALAVLALLVIFYRNKRNIAILLAIQNDKLRQVNDALEEANQTKAKLFGIISHDLRAPVSQIYQLLRLQNSKNSIIDKEEQLLLEKQTHDATRTLLDEMENVLLWSKSQLQHFKPNIELVNIKQVITQCLQLNALKIKDQQIIIANNIEDSSTIQTDPAMLLIIIRNLIQNALSASPNKGVISFYFTELDNNNQKPCLKISNQGTPFTQTDYEQALIKAKAASASLGGFGLQIIEELSKAIQVTIFFESLEENKTYCSLFFNGSSTQH